MPHNFIRMSPESPNPGRWTREQVKSVCERHEGTLEHVWHEPGKTPKAAYVLVKDGDVQGMLEEFNAEYVIRLVEINGS
jgi:phenolic acid decarboxylase